MTSTTRYLFLSLISLICFASAEQNLNANPLSQNLQKVLNAYDDLCRDIDEFSLNVAQFENLRKVSMLKCDWKNLCNCMEKFKKKVEIMNHTLHNMEHVWSEFDTKVCILESGMRRTVKEIRSLKMMAKITEMKLELLASSIDRVLVSCNRETERNGFRLAFIAEDMIFLVSAGIVFSFVLGSLILMLPLIRLPDIACATFKFALKWLSPRWS
ncbi:uncharacterized protein LOC141592908 [Silene latifolia]|uniref:uncharacterized protein LOC141592908 n=1 Tax=Silene latifolia TaxID=37657 RepID=UPI003D76A73F